MPERALEGITVVECGRTGAAAYAAKLMADVGATVIKVEPPGQGDPARDIGPYPGGEPNLNASGTYLYLNTNKQGVTLDISTAKGRDVLDRLIAKADVLVHDFPPREADVLGLTYERIGASNPELVMTSIFPFGASGPHSEYAATDMTILAAGGWMFINGWPGHSEMPPLKPYGFQAAYQGGVNAALATMGALYARQRGMGGQHIEISLQECISSIIESSLAVWTYMKTPVARYGNRPIHPIDMFECKDGNYIFALCIEEHQWQHLVEVMETPEWTTWDVAANRFARASNWDALRPFMEEWVSQWNARDLYEAAQAKRVPFAVASTMGSLLESEHLNVRGFFVEVVHPEAGPLRHPGAPFRMTETPWEIRSPAPTLGQHNDLVYSDIGLSGDELTSLQSEGVI